MADTLIKKVIREIVKDELKPVESRLGNLEKQTISFQEQFFAEFAKFRSDIYNLIDPVAGQLKKFNEEIYQEVQKLKTIHPKNSHQTVVV